MNSNNNGSGNLGEDNSSLSQDPAQTITITIMEPSSALGDTVDRSSVSVSNLNSSHLNSVVSSGSGITQEEATSAVISEKPEHILQTSISKTQLEEEFPVISNISNPEEEESLGQEVTKESEIYDEEVDIAASSDPHCLVCNKELPQNTDDTPVAIFQVQTTATQRKMSVMLGVLVGQKITSRKSHSDLLCSRCYNLLDKVDSLEIELQDTKDDLINNYQSTYAIYGGRPRRKKAATAKKKEFVFPKIEPDEIEREDSLEFDSNFEPRAEDLLEEEADQQEDLVASGALDDEWEPEFKKPKLKRENTDADGGVAPKRRRGRPRKDITKAKMKPKKTKNYNFSYQKMNKMFDAIASKKENLSIRFELKFDFEDFMCNCGLKHKTVNEHLKHVTSHTTGPFKCPDCVNNFSTSQCLEFHQCLVHKRNKNNMEICISSCFDSNYPLYSLQSGLVVCPCCGYKILNDLEMHMNTHLNGCYHCPICSIHLQSFYDVEIHMKYLHLDFLESYLSSLKSLITSRESNIELLSHLKCNICNKVFENAPSFKSHKYLQHPEHYPFCCLLCNLYFSSRLDMDNHSCTKLAQELVIVESNNEKDLDMVLSKTCSICQYVCKSNISLQRNLKESHGNDETLSFNCTVCNMVLNTRKAFSDHLRCHKRNGFQCKFCHSHLQTIDSLNVHINEIHTHEIQYRCKYCSQTFFSSGRLSYHIKRHHTDRCSYPNLCHLCGKTYPYPSELKHHLRSHRGERIYKCDVCQKSFLKQGDLTYHKRKHTGEKPHKCPHCDLRFPRPNTLKNHIRVIHPSKLSLVGSKQLELNIKHSSDAHIQIDTSKFPLNDVTCSTELKTLSSMVLPSSKSSYEYTKTLTIHEKCVKNNSISKDEIEEEENNLSTCLKPQFKGTMISDESVRKNTSETSFATTSTEGNSLVPVMESDELVVEGPVTHLQPVEYVELDNLPDGTELQSVQVVFLSNSHEY